MFKLSDDLKITWYFLGGHASSVTAAKVIDQQRRWNRRLLISSFLFRTNLFFDGSLQCSQQEFFQRAYTWMTFCGHISYQFIV